MAFSTRSSFFFFTILVLLSTQIHARDSYFFGKFHRESPKDQNTNNALPLETNQKTTVEASIPNEKEQQQDPSFIPESENGYGLYGHETTYNNNNNNNNKEEFNNNNKYDEKFNGETFSSPSLSEKEESYNNNNNNNNNNNKEEFNNNNNKYDEKFNGETFSTPSLSEKEESYNNYDEKYPKKNGYNNEEFNNKYGENSNEDNFSENNEEKTSYYNSDAYGTELERETPYKGYSHNLERQGMSDTRFMEKGNYYYDLYNDRNHGHYYRKPQQKTPAGYYSTPATENIYEQSNSNGNYNNNEEEKRFKDPYNSKWENNEQSEEFVEEQDNHFKP